MPYSALGTLKCDWGGRCTGDLKGSLGGVIIDETLASGATQMNGDCTATISYDVKVNGQPAGKLNAIIHVLEDGKGGVSMSVDPGTNVVCTIRLMSR